MGCGSDAMVTYLLLRRLLPSSFATSTAPTSNISIGLEFHLSKLDNTRNISLCPFGKYKYLKLKLGVFLAGHTIAMVTLCQKITKCLAMIR